MSPSLWGEKFNLPDTKVKTKKVINKVTKPKKPITVEKVIKSKSISIFEKLELITSKVNEILGSYKDKTTVITSRQVLHDYIDHAIQNDEIAIDTETNNSLDPITCKLMGACIYTEGEKQAYIPINHIDINTNELLENQLTEKDIKEEFDRLSNTKIIMHNAKFDIKVIKCTCGCSLNCYWDTMIGAKILNNLEKAGLKEQYVLHIDNDANKYDIEHLFDIEYGKVDPNIFALYAATDASKTLDLYKYQLSEFSKPENSKLFKLFSEVEMKVLPVIIDMELTGIEIDKEYTQRLHDKYTNKLIEIDNKISEELKQYNDVISKWRLTSDANYKEPHTNKNGEVVYKKSKSEQLENPVKVSSPTQLAILLYDVLKSPVVDKKSPRGTGEEILKNINLPICDMIIEKKHIDKLLSAFIDKLPSIVNEKDNKLHASFNQLGTDTGRFSSSDPNLQQIPSHNKEIRMMFSSGDGNVFVGGDFSQQEPRLLAHYSGDKNMINNFIEGKEIYATVASLVYGNKYEDNLEYHADGTDFPEGKARRSSCKSLILGMMYGRGPSSIAEQIGKSLPEAQKLIDDFYNQFPLVKKWQSETEKNAKKLGYVEDFYGRRRYLPDIKLEPYEIKDNNNYQSINPLLDINRNISKNDKLINSYIKKLNSCKSKKEISDIINQAKNDNLSIKDNSGFIAQAERQCVNARVQGGAATLTKIAMINIFNDEELKKLGFKLLLTIHDEVIGNCPIENAEKACERLKYIMINSLKDVVVVPMDCDVQIEDHWYENDYKSNLKKEYRKHNNLDKLYKDHPEVDKSYIEKLIKEN